MLGNILYKDDFISIISCNDGLYIESYQKGFSSAQLYSLLSTHPQIDVVNFNVIRNAINTAPQPWRKFGCLKEKIEIDILDNGLKAVVSFNLPPEDLSKENRGALVKELSGILKEKGIVFGLKSDILMGELQPGKSYVIAEGIAPEHGIDSVITMYELKETAPEVYENGKVNFYKVKLINHVKSGDWLGEKTDATEGASGKSVEGKVIPSIKGKTLPLLYDKNTVTEVQSPGKVTLYSKINGAVNYSDGKISVSNHLDIDGNVDFKTGNIKFDGYVTIHGTVSDGFSVEATKDIEINSDLGLGNIKEIVSSQGSIFIKGGIASKGKAEIHAARDIFTKFVDNATLVCGGSVHIGFYSVNSKIDAKEVIIDSTNGHILGGITKAEIKVVAPTIGSEYEKRTVVEVTGFDREALKHELEATFSKISALKNEQQKLKQLLSGTTGIPQTDSFYNNQYRQNQERLFEIREEIKKTEETRKNLSNYLKAKGEGEISITKKVFPNSQLIVKRKILEVNNCLPSCSLFIQDGELKQV